jgi:hypothetical protein
VDPVTRVAPASLNYRHTIQRQLYVDSEGWVRRMDIDATVEPNEGNDGAFDSVLTMFNTIRIAVKLDGSRHRLETSYLHQLQLADGKPADG